MSIPVISVVHNITDNVTTTKQKGIVITAAVQFPEGNQSNNQWTGEVSLAHMDLGNEPTLMDCDIQGSFSVTGDVVKKIPVEFKCPKDVGHRSYGDYTLIFVFKLTCGDIVIEAHTTTFKIPQQEKKKKKTSDGTPNVKSGGRKRGHPNATTTTTTTTTSTSSALDAMLRSFMEAIMKKEALIAPIIGGNPRILEIFARLVVVAAPEIAGVVEKIQLSKQHENQLDSKPVSQQAPVVSPYCQSTQYQSTQYQSTSSLPPVPQPTLMECDVPIINFTGECNLDSRFPNASMCSSVKASVPIQEHLATQGLPDTLPYRHSQFPPAQVNNNSISINNNIPNNYYNNFPNSNSNSFPNSNSNSSNSNNNNNNNNNNFSNNFPNSNFPINNYPNNNFPNNENDDTYFDSNNFDPMSFINNFNMDEAISLSLEANVNL